MNCASARCRRATGPFRKVKREPDSLAPVSKSRPSGAPRSTWSFTSKSKLRGVPQRRTSMLPVSSVPSGTLSSGRLGTPISRWLSSCWIASSRSAPALSSSAMLPTSAICAVASSPLPLAMPICLDSALRRACNSSVRVCTALRSASRALKRSTSRNGWGFLRAFRRSMTVSSSLRSWVMSSMSFFQNSNMKTAPMSAPPEVWDGGIKIGRHSPRPWTCRPGLPAAGSARFLQHPAGCARWWRRAGAAGR
mmetsp:Transcript_60027/g.142064  ORF Transcript_60027/g.142064 Transcript_60027/m.142064 type:complete len:250 (+) Transcript_60027:134-883(+)